MLRIGIVLYRGFQVINLALTTVFEFANMTASEALYEVVLLSEHGGPVQTSAGFAVVKPYRLFDIKAGRHIACGLLQECHCVNCATSIHTFFPLGQIMLLCLGACSKGAFTIRTA